MDSSSHDETETGLRGFRKRWRESVSMASVAASEARVSEIDGLDAISLDLEPDGSEDYDPSIQPEGSQSSGSVQVAATGSSEFGWRCEALESAVKRTRLFCLGTTCFWRGFSKAGSICGDNSFWVQAFFCTYSYWSI